MEQLPTDREYQEELRRRTGLARPTAESYLMDFMSVAPVMMGMPVMSVGGRIPKRRVVKPKSNLTHYDIFSYQDKIPEKIVHRDWNKSNAFRHVLEGAGDILRETSLHSDPGYIAEKSMRIHRYLERVNKGRLHPIDSVEEARKSQGKNLSDLIKAYRKQPTITKDQQLAKDLTLSIAEGRHAEARSFLDHFRTKFKEVE